MYMLLHEYIFHCNLMQIAFPHCASRIIARITGIRIPNRTLQSLGRRQPTCIHVHMYRICQSKIIGWNLCHKTSSNIRGLTYTLSLLPLYTDKYGIWFVEGSRSAHRLKQSWVCTGEQHNSSIAFCWCWQWFLKNHLQCTSHMKLH